MSFCPAGAAPNSAGAAVDVVWVDFATIASSIGTALYNELKVKVPYAILGLAPQYFTISSLCASNPDPPQPITLADIEASVLGFGSPLTGVPALFSKLSQYLQWYAFRTFCQCNTATPSCVALHEHISLNDTLNFATGSQCYSWPSIPSGTTASSTLVYQPWNIGCATVDITLTADIGPGTQPLLNPLIIRDCNNVYWNQASIGGVTHTATLSAGGTLNNCPGWGLVWCGLPGSFPSWFVDIVPHTGQTGTTPPIPDAPAPQTGNGNAYPTPACDSTTLCNVQTTVLYNSQQIQYALSVVAKLANQITQAAAASTYSLGTAHTVTGNGQFSVNNIAGVLVAPSLTTAAGLSDGDPQEVFADSFVTFGDANGWQRSYPVTHETMLVLGARADTTLVGYTGGATSSMLITELVPVYPT